MFDMPYRRFDAFRDYVTITILAMGLVFIVSIFVIDITSPSVPQKRFEVVDKYESCDVVRYTTPSNEWVYFLDCSPTKPAARKALE
jgi:hypothetical protein